MFGVWRVCYGELGDDWTGTTARRHNGVRRTWPTDPSNRLCWTRTAGKTPIRGLTRSGVSMSSFGLGCTADGRLILLLDDIRSRLYSFCRQLLLIANVGR